MSKVSVDWREAGYRADATRVLNLYRRSFDNEAKKLARSRSIEALRAAGVKTVVCLWGGGYDAEELVAAGFRVIAVDNGSMIVMDGERAVSDPRKRRALRYAAEAGGYEWRWGNVSRFLPEADGALLDFHGPWARDKRLIIGSARHMTAVVVVLVPSHDVSADASSSHERQMAYQLFLKMAWADRPRWEAMTTNGHVRRLTDYHEDQGRHVFVYLLGRQHVKLSVMPLNQRAKMRRDMASRVRAKSRAYYHRLDDAGKTRWQDRSRHNDHVRSGVLPCKPCQVCGSMRSISECSMCRARFVARGRQVYCGKVCRDAAKISRQRDRRIANPKAIKLRKCVVCQRDFSWSGVRGSHGAICGEECRLARKRRRASDWAAGRRVGGGQSTEEFEAELVACGFRVMRMRQGLAAVSGTTAEAILSEEAA